MAAGRIFISYRRGPDNGATGRLYDRLERHFDASQLFMDVDSIPLGRDFVEHLDQHVGRCNVFLAIIGPGWVAALDRLADPDDFVRIEIESALRRPDTLVIPILVGDATLPEAAALPESLRALTRRNGIVVPHHLFSATVDGKLVHAIEGHVGGTSGPAGGRGRTLGLVALAGLAAAGLASYLLLQETPEPAVAPPPLLPPTPLEPVQKGGGGLPAPTQVPVAPGLGRDRAVIEGPFRATLSYSGSPRSLAIEWAEMTGRFPALLEGRGRLITDNSTAQKRVFFLYTGPFQTEAAAKAFCDALLRAGHPRCSAGRALIGDPVD